MKYYRLTKDLPTFKKGELFWMNEYGSLISNDWNIVAYAGSTIAKFPNILEDWFKEVHKPLIKDEKIRKAVRAWAEANVTRESDEIKKAFYDGDEWELKFNEFGVARIQFNRPLNIGIEDKEYTIAELCGEEEDED